MTSGRMTGHAQSFQVTFARMSTQKLVRGSDIFKCSGPSPATISDSSVFNIPGCDSSLGQRGTQMSCIIQIVLGSPVAAVNKEDNGMWLFAAGNADVYKLIGVGTVHGPAIRLRRFPAQNGFALHCQQYKRRCRAATSRAGYLA